MAARLSNDVLNQKIEFLSKDQIDLKDSLKDLKAELYRSNKQNQVALRELGSEIKNSYSNIGEKIDTIISNLSQVQIAKSSLDAKISVIEATLSNVTEKTDELKVWKEQASGVNKFLHIMIAVLTLISMISALIISNK